MPGTSATSLRRLTPAIAAILLLALALRVAAGRGGLWMDEAWSALFADETRTPVGIFLFINHDNNHHLNTLWLQLVGIGAPPLLARALSIAAGCAAVWVAAVLGARRSPACGWVTGLLFAVSEAMVTYGSEARGYAPMLLCALAAVLLVDRWLDAPDTPPPARPLALWAAAGLLSHLTMVFALGALGIWTLAALRRSTDWRTAIGRALALFWPAALATLLALALIFVPALVSPKGFQVASSVPFTFTAFSETLGQILWASLGPAARPWWLLPLAAALGIVAVALVRPRLLGPRAPFYLLLILGVPLALALLQPSNGTIIRYYLLSCTALLLLASEWIAAGIDRGGWPRIAALALLTVSCAWSLSRDLALISNQRGHPDGAVRMLARMEPKGARIAIANSRAQAQLAVAARELGYRLAIVDGACGGTRYLFIDRDPGKPAHGTVQACGRSFAALASDRTTGLSGDDWTLYEWQRLPSAATPVSHPPPAP